MDMTVSRKPSAVCNVSAVPTYLASDASLTIAENCAESATTAIPHTSETSNTTYVWPNDNAINKQQAPLTAIDQMVTLARCAIRADASA